MGRGDAEAESGDALGYCGEHDGCGDDAMVAEFAGEEGGGDLVVQDYGDDGGLGEAGVVAEGIEAFAEVVSVGFEAGDALGFFFEDGEAFGDGSDGRGGHGGGEDVGAGGVLEEDGDLLGDGDEATDGGDGLGEGAGPDVDFAGVDTEVLIGAAAGGSDDAGGVGLVDEEEAAELFFDGDEIGEAADVSVHGEDAVGDDDGAVGWGAFLDLFAEAFGVVVAEALDLYAGHFAGVEEAAVAEGVDDDAVGGAEESGDEAEVGHVSGGEGDGGFGTFEGGEVALDLTMDVEGAGEEACAAGAGAVASDGVPGCGVDAGVTDEPEVVVGRHHEHLVTVGLDTGAGLGFEGHVEGVGIGGDAEGGGLEDAAGASVEEVVLLEVPLAGFGEVLTEHAAGGRREDFGLSLLGGKCIGRL